ncbi:hypothetical protein AAFF_G00211840 [Aldrovandia affinis]|uniref:Uncharacterized protein n=1 Tax=Aldrovandia affinis TaxID=143900 RepID=A0AAD7RHI6_9TELE|nr:hypothetical protein AAFF_G00211840 [Aldrovandia affinis]
MRSTHIPAEVCERFAESRGLTHSALALCSSGRCLKSAHQTHTQARRNGGVREASLQCEYLNRSTCRKEALAPAPLALALNMLQDSHSEFPTLERFYTTETQSRQLTGVPDSGAHGRLSHCGTILSSELLPNKVGGVQMENR